MADNDSSPLTDVLRRAREGDESAQNELFEQCRSYVNVIARAQVESWLQAKVDSSDLVQQTLLEAHRGLGNFRGTTEGEWFAWLKRITANNAADFVRQFHGTQKRQARREVRMHAIRPDQSGGLQIDPSDPGGTPSEVVIKRERELEVANAVSQLADDYQEVIMLRNLQRLPFDEVARRMNRSRPATQMLWMRALQKLRELI